MQIAIIGGGIAGITAGIALQRRGFKVDVFEQAPEFKEIGAVLAALPNGMEVLKSFDLVDYILEKGGEFHEFRVNSPAGKLIRKSEFHYKLPAVVIRRSDLLNGLLSKINPSSLHPNHKLVDYVQGDNGKVHLSFANGSTFEYDAVIGADGIHSIIRKKLLNDGEPIYRGYNLWRGVGKLSQLPSYSCETWGSGVRFGFYPLHNNQIGWWAAIEEPANCSDNPPGIKEKLLERFGSWHHPIPEIIANTDHIIKNHISDRKPLKKWYERQAVLIGDAAHCTTPNLGQGANMAMESALLLARCIEKYGLNETAFSAYENVQFSRTKNINRQSLFIGKLGQLKNPILIALRNTVLRLLPIRLATKTYDVYYRFDATTLPID